ncbi:MAG TPA: HD domain-containing phosphohydrolase [Actinomycetota bacterium]|nr:HD domain-containing phosphohydrolase [Actinomycetota bacterium]
MKSVAAKHPDARVLVVDDEEPNVLLLEGMLAEAGYANVVSTTDPTEVAAIIGRSMPDLILLDLHMPHLDGFEVLRMLQALGDPSSRSPVIVLTADITREAKQRALASGASDFLSKPFDFQEVLLRIRNILHMRFLDQALRRERDTLEDRVTERTKDLEEAQTETFERLALAAEFRDDDTGQHTVRVGTMAALIAERLGLPHEEVETLRRAAALHDVGKIGIPDSILLAPRKLTPDEFEVIKKHTEIGAKILSGSKSPVLAMGETIAWSHHERWDGNGYAGSAGEDIPLVGRITTVADVFDALTHERPYKRAWSVDEALEEMMHQRGQQFDPTVLDVFLQIAEIGAEIPVSSWDPSFGLATGRVNGG